MDYQNSFINRVDSFLHAIHTFPNCYDNELKVAIEMINPLPNESIVNIGGGGIYLQKFLNENINYIPLEFSKEFSEKCNIPFCKYDSLPLQNDSIDKFLILALLHHFNENERDILYKEIYRSLKKGGKLILSDVIINSDQDLWLNIVVDQFNPFGHKGNFFSEEDSELLIQNGFDVKIENKKYYWEFQDENEMIQFMKHLFYLKISDEKCLSFLKQVFDIKNENNKIKLEWILIYFICSKID